MLSMHLCTSRRVPQIAHVRSGTDFSSNRSGHYNRALEEAVQTHKSQWAKDWESKNPLSGGATFSSMSPSQRVRESLEFLLFANCSSSSLSYEL
jgi:hypothetical protein